IESHDVALGRDVLDAGKYSGQGVSGGRVAKALQVPDDVFYGDWLTVMPAHPFAQAHGDFVAVRAPTELVHQARLQRQVVPLFDVRVVHRFEYALQPRASGVRAAVGI